MRIPNRGRFREAADGFHQALWFPPCPGCRNWEKRGLFTMNGYNLSVEMSLLPLNAWLSCSCCSPGGGHAASYKVRILGMPATPRYSYPVYGLNFLLKLVSESLSCALRGKSSKSALRALFPLYWESALRSLSPSINPALPVHH